MIEFCLHIALLCQVAFKSENQQRGERSEAELPVSCSIEQLIHIAVSFTQSEISLFQ